MACLDSIDLVVGGAKSQRTPQLSRSLQPRPDTLRSHYGEEECGRASAVLDRGSHQTDLLYDLPHAFVTRDAQDILGLLDQAVQELDRAYDVG